MRGLRHILLVVAFVVVVSVCAPAGALAAGCTGSAGDSQYVDPLQNCNPPPSGHTGSGSTTPTPSNTPATTTTTASTPTATTASTTTTTASTTTAARDPKTGKSLPRTGLDLLPALLVAVALLSGGFALRRVVGDPRS